MRDEMGRAPVPLRLSRDARVGETAILAGWGKDQGSVTATLRAGVAVITAVTSLTLQTAFSASFSSVCQGDSGGPILLSDGGGWASGGRIPAQPWLPCSYRDHFYANRPIPGLNAYLFRR